MKLKTFLEMAQIERIGSRSIIKKSDSAAPFDKFVENKLIKLIDTAFSESQELKDMFFKNEFPPYDIEIGVVGPNVKITTNPENGQKSKTALFPFTNFEKFLKDPKGKARDDPKGLASFLVMGYKKSIKK